MTYVPCLGIIAHHFQKRRALAMGIVASGSSVGAIIHPIMLNHLFHSSVGFHNGVRASAGLNLGLLGFAVLLMRTRFPPQKAGNAVPIADFVRDIPYAVTALGYVHISQVLSVLIFLPGAWPLSLLISSHSSSYNWMPYYMASIQVWRSIWFASHATVYGQRLTLHTSSRF
jgi:MFS family permease